MPQKPTLLFTTPVLRHPPVSGPNLRIENSIKALSQISDLYIYSRVSQKSIGGENGLSFYRRYCRQFEFAPNTVPVHLESNETHSAVLDYANGIKPDLIWLGYGNISYPLLRYIKKNSDYKVVVDTDSVWSKYLLRGLPYAENEADRSGIAREGAEKEEEEKWGSQIADVTTAVSEVDAMYYRKLARRPEQVHLFSNVIDVANYRFAPPPPDHFRKPCMCLTGTFFANSPMRDAALWVISKVMPLVQRRIADVHFYIIGNGSDIYLSDVKDANITVTGELPSVLPYLCHADVALVPLRFESGTRFKILEAGACRVPVVSTRLGAEGLPVHHRRDILIADSPKAFAQAIVEVMMDRVLAKRLTTQCKELIESQFSIEALVKQGVKIIDDLNCN